MSDEERRLPPSALPLDERGESRDGLGDGGKSGVVEHLVGEAGELRDVLRELPVGPDVA